MTSDYHLIPKEQQRIERLVPLHQAKIHLAFKADLVVDNKKYKEGAVALSEHMIVLCKKSLIGKTLNEICSIHLLDIQNFSTSSDSNCKLVTELHSVHISSKAVLRFARCLIRNYYVITIMFPNELRFQFRPHDPESFKPFNPHMSPSQMFQFSYNANCSYYNTSYDHEVARFFHQMVIEGNGIADLSHLPLNHLEVNFGDPLQLRPVFNAWMFCPLIFGVVCSHIARPDLAASVAPLLIANQDVRVVILNDCHIEEGMIAVGNAIKNNRNNDVVFWDLSNNNLRDGAAFCESLAKTRANVFYLDVSNTSLDGDATNILFKAIATNHHLNDLKYLHVEGCTFTKDTVHTFIHHLKHLAVADNRQLRSLNIANIGHKLDLILEGLVKYLQPIEFLNISNNSLKAKAYEVLCIFLMRTQALKELNISYTSVKVEMVEGIIKNINSNNHLDKFSLNLSGNSIRGKKLVPIIKLFEKSNLSKWEALYFDDCGLSTGDLSSLISLFKRMPNLKKISLSENFTYKTKGIDKLLIQLLSIETLDTIIIRGKAPKRGLGIALIPFINELKNNTQIRTLDISFNQIGDTGLNSMSNVLQKNNTLAELQIDGSQPKNHESVVKFFDVLAASKNIISSDFPTEDIYQMMNNLSTSKMKAQIFEMLSAKQRNVQISMKKNMAANGLHSNLSLLHIPELDTLLDEVTVCVHDRLAGMKICEHSGLAAAFGLPMPHLGENEDQTKGAVSTNTGNDKDEDLEGSNVIVIEGNKQVDDSTDGLQTLLYNSLCINRPERKATTFSIDEDVEGLLAPSKNSSSDGFNNNYNYNDDDDEISDSQNKSESENFLSCSKSSGREDNLEELSD
ncbi:hypothetical protein TRFO_11107 [Tritrichomonas foetus]|uniref:Leucine Rich Repeat family protein n=1 Tax=Tritrichomonas foetus TaxID=1144522 RepID=A0A1J4JB65_9EUKA|nr:hypothetical protein TRFO_11107 [Tritrichomonas foetus]|eukprot:OHS94484.1 hypothetical protein TRFO_11107 [Tritrichomonas foetus]